ncbi:unnamed protein product [Cyclocybe aegerita]|uniref:Uncharacterized protein n=1 Tax=Cyclocybe aegerita TaxID=1973307 RepID=A0A8S0VZV4_CYCAE|nr:unnamed protein product [Cyclocybe aegerita]
MSSREQGQVQGGPQQTFVHMFLRSSSPAGTASPPHTPSTCPTPTGHGRQRTLVYRLVHRMVLVQHERDHVCVDPAALQVFRSEGGPTGERGKERFSELGVFGEVGKACGGG